MSNLYLEIIKCFVDHVDVNIQGPDGKTALHYAVESNDLDLVNLLFSKENANPFVRDNSGKSPWNSTQESEVLETLINCRYGQEQDSLLHLATMMGEPNAVRYLIRRGMNVNARNALNHTPLHLAAGLGDEDIINILVQEGNAEIDVFDARNQSPMHYAVNNKKLSAVTVKTRSKYRCNKQSQKFNKIVSYSSSCKQ